MSGFVLLFCNLIDNNHWGFPYFLLFDERVIAFADTVRYNRLFASFRRTGAGIVFRPISTAIGIAANLDVKKTTNSFGRAFLNLKKKLYFGGKKSLNSVKRLITSVVSVVNERRPSETER